jgi:hypothetical protein
MRMREENASLIPVAAVSFGRWDWSIQTQLDIEKENTFTMKLLKLTVMFGGLVALATSVSAESAMVNFNAPFEFVVGGKVLPAGSYTIEEPSNGGVVMIRGNQPNSTALVLAVNGGPSNTSNARVTFSRNGSAVVLSTINVPGGATYSLMAPRTAAAVTVALPRK